MFPRRPPSVLLGLRTGLLLAAACALAGAVGLAQRRALVIAGAPREQTCPMHPEVRVAEPGPCPICGMALVLRARAATGGATFPLPAGRQVPAAAIGHATVMTLDQEITAPAWLDRAGPGPVLVALLYADEVAGLRPGEKGLFQIAPRAGQAPASPLSVTLLAGPAPSWDQATRQVRWQGQDLAGLPAGAVGQLVLPARERPVTVVPYPAVVAGPHGAHALIVGPDRGTIAARPIATGRTVFDHATVVSGLGVDDEIVLDPAPLFEAERRLGAPGTEAQTP